MGCVLAAVISLALGSGWGRSGEDSLAGLQPRYTTLAILVLVVIYFIFASYGPRFMKNFMPMMLLTGACILLWPNVETAWAAGRTAHAEAEQFDRDLAAGTPLFRLVRRYTPFLHPSQESLHEALELLHQRGVGKFRSLREDPAFQEQVVTLAPTEVRLARWNEGRIEVTDIDPWVRFDLPSPVYVCGIRLRYSHSGTERFPRCAFGLPGASPDSGTSRPSSSTATGVYRPEPIAPRPSGSTMRSTRIQIQPDNRPCEFTIAELTLLVPRRGAHR